MILTRAPLRISLGGGGTDLPSYYRRHGGFVVSAAIDRHVYMLANTAFQDRYRLKHLEWEEVDEPGDIRHPFLREALVRNWDGGPMEISSTADVPPGTGLGSSGAYTVCALRTIELARGSEPRAAGDLAEEACAIEIDALGRTVGKQDQYVSAHGGLRAYTFAPDDSVQVQELDVTPETRQALGERFLLFYTGGTRSASTLLSDQVSRSAAGDEQVEQNLHRTKELAQGICAALERGDLDACSELMNLQWETKRARSASMVTERIDELRSAALAASGQAAMLMGAGGAGFLLVHSADPERTRAALAAAGAPELPFGIDYDGCVALRPGRPWPAGAPG